MKEIGSSGVFKYTYHTPDGFSDIWMDSDGEFLTGLRFEGSRYHSGCPQKGEVKLLPVFEETINWLDVYFQGKNPEFLPQYRVDDLTPFRKEVIDRMMEIPFGKTVSYGEIAESLAKAHVIPRMSSRAVGGAVGWNPICIIIPCHRVIGANRSLTGYGGGILNKISLLKLEGHDMTAFSVPKKGL